MNPSTPTYIISFWQFLLSIFLWPQVSVLVCWFFFPQRTWTEFKNKEWRENQKSLISDNFLENCTIGRWSSSFICGRIQRGYICGFTSRPHVPGADGFLLCTPHETNPPVLFIYSFMAEGESVRPKVIFQHIFCCNKQVFLVQWLSSQEFSRV